MDHEIRKSRVVTLLLPTIGVSYYLFGPSGMRYGGHAVTQRRNFPFDALGMKFLFVFPRGTRFLLDSCSITDGLSSTGKLSNGTCQFKIFDTT
jgi:hypothetical protein